MSLEQFIHADWTQNNMNSGDSSLNEGTSASAAVTSSTDNHSTAFECNICLDYVQDPVVTFCGHLFCWPCIYRWLHQKRIADKKQEEHLQDCPVCKAEISESALIPLYGRGQTTNPLKAKASDIDMVIPNRPIGPAKNIGMLKSPNRLLYPDLSEHYHSHTAQSQMHRPYLGNYNASHTFSPSGSETLRSVCSPLMRMFVDMVYARMFGNSDTDLYAPPSYHLGHITNPRVRRRIMQADKSLGRISFFLFCCVLLCLVSF